MDDFIPFSEREEWKDVEPIPEFDPAPPIAPIDYSPICKFYLVVEIMSYFRAIIKAEEISIRAFNLTQEVIDISPGFYTAWHYRLKLLNDPSLGIPLEPEVEYLNEIGP